MRAIYFLLACSLFLSQSCTLNDVEPQSEFDYVNGTWNLQNVSGGFAGVDDDFENGAILWTFNTNNGQLKVINNSDGSSIYSGLETGSYPFSIQASSDASILYINTREYGGLGELKNGFLINQNEMANGSGADGFLLKFKK